MHGIFGKMSAVKGEAAGVCLGEENVGSKEVRGVNIAVVGEGGVEGEGEGIEGGALNWEMVCSWDTQSLGIIVRLLGLLPHILVWVRGFFYVC